MSGRSEGGLDVGRLVMVRQKRHERDWRAGQDDVEGVIRGYETRKAAIVLNLSAGKGVRDTAIVVKVNRTSVNGCVDSVEDCKAFRIAIDWLGARDRTIHIKVNTHEMVLAFGLLI